MLFCQQLRAAWISKCASWTDKKSGAININYFMIFSLASLQSKAHSIATKEPKLKVYWYAQKFHFDNVELKSWIIISLLYVYDTNWTIHNCRCECHTIDCIQFFMSRFAPDNLLQSVFCGLCMIYGYFHRHCVIYVKFKLTKFARLKVIFNGCAN